MTFVNALSSTGSWYSSGPITPSMCARPSRSMRDPRGPVARGLDEEARAGAGREVLVAGPVEVARRRPGHVGDDVLLELAGPDRHDLAGASPGRGGRDVAARRGRLPREAGARAGRVPLAASQGRGQASQPVLEHRPRGRRVGRGEERQHEDVAVPEHVAAVAGPAQAARSDGRLALVGDRRHQVEQREADRALELRVALDHDVGVLPTRGPRLAVLAEQALEAGLSGLGESGERAPFRGGLGRVDDVGG